MPTPCTRGGFGTGFSPKPLCSVRKNPINTSSTMQDLIQPRAYSPQTSPSPRSSLAGTRPPSKVGQLRYTLLCSALLCPVWGLCCPCGCISSNPTSVTRGPVPAIQHRQPLTAQKPGRGKRQSRVEAGQAVKRDSFLSVVPSAPERNSPPSSGSNLGKPSRAPGQATFTAKLPSNWGGEKNPTPSEER